MNAKYQKRKARMLEMINSREPSERRDGRKKQRSRSVKLNRLQRNLTDTQSGRARGEMTYFSGGLFDKPDMFIG